MSKKLRHYVNKVKQCLDYLHLFLSFTLYSSEFKEFHEKLKFEKKSWRVGSLEQNWILVSNVVVLVSKKDLGGFEENLAGISNSILDAHWLVH